MAPTLCAVLVIASALWTTVRTEQRYRVRWQSVERPPVRVGEAAYRTADVLPGRVGRAPWVLRAVAFTCVLYGRASLLALGVLLAGAMGRVVHGVTHLVNLVVFAYAAGAWVAGAPALLMVAGMVLRAGTELLQRNHTTAVTRAVTAAVLALALHATVAVRLLTGHGAPQERWVMAFILGSCVHAVALAAATLAYRTALTTRPALLR